MPKPVGKKKKSDEEAAAAAAAETLRKIEAASLCFKALGDSTRLRVVLFLRASANAPFDKGGSETLSTDEEVPAHGSITVGAVAFHLTGSDKVSSNISHHLKELRHAGLIAMKRRGKNILCRVEQSALEALESLLCASNDEILRQVLVSGEAPVKPAAKATPKKRQSSAPEVSE